MRLTLRYFLAFRHVVSRRYFVLLSWRDQQFVARPGEAVAYALVVLIATLFWSGRDLTFLRPGEANSTLFLAFRHVVSRGYFVLLSWRDQQLVARPGEAVAFALIVLIATPVLVWERPNFVMP